MITIKNSCECSKRALTPFLAKFGTTSEKLLDKGLKGERFVDKGNKGNINVFSRRPDGKSGFVRVTLDPKGERVISAGLNKARDVAKGIEKGRFVPLKKVK